MDNNLRTGREPSLGGGEKPNSGDEPSLPGDFKVLKAMLAEDLAGFPVLHADRLERLKVIRTRGSAALPALLALCRESDTQTRSSAIATLGLIGAVEAIPALAEILSGPDGDLHRPAAIALCNIGGPAEKEIRQLLHQPDAEIRQYGISALGSLLGAEIIPVLAELITREGRPEVLLHVIRTLDPVDDIRVLPLLENILLDTPDYRVKGRAFDTITRFDDRAAVDSLMRIYAIGSPMTRREALENLGQTRAPAALSIIKEALDSDDSWLRSSAFKALKYYGDPGLIPMLESLPDDPRYAGAQDTIAYLRDPEAYEDEAELYGEPPLRTRQRVQEPGPDERSAPESDHADAE